MAIRIRVRPEPTVGDITPCPTCGHVQNAARRLHAIACCGLDSHAVAVDFSLLMMTHQLAHYWRDSQEYAAVESEREITEADALAWIERAHAGEVQRRKREHGVLVECDRWEG